MGNGNGNLRRDDSGLSGLSSQIEPKFSLTLACETNQGRLGTHGSLSLSMSRTAERIWRRVYSTTINSSHSQSENNTDLVVMKL